MFRKLYPFPSSGVRGERSLLRWARQNETVLDLASYRLKSRNSSKEQTIAEVLKTLCVIAPTIFSSVINICNYDW
jgi:hypothetical protein